MCGLHLLTFFKITGGLTGAPAVFVRPLTNAPERHFAVRQVLLCQHKKTCHVHVPTNRNPDEWF